MRRDTRRQGQQPGKVMWSGLALLLIACWFIFSGCGKAPSDHPLISSTDTPASQVSPASTVSPASQLIPVHVIDSKTNITTYPGGNMVLTISTSPYAVCSFVVSYGASTPSSAIGIVPRTADGDGIASWSWRVDPSAHLGTWPLTLSATLADGEKTTTKIDVQVVFPGISVVNSQSTLTGSPNGSMSLTISTAPFMNCTLLLNYGPGIPGKTLTRRSNLSGIASWNWRVDRAATTGVWPLTVTVILPDGESSSTRVDTTIV